MNKKMLILVVLIFASLFFIKSVSADSLVIDNSTVTLGGYHNYDYVKIINGGILQIADYNGSINTGKLNLSATYNITVDSTSMINGSGNGWRGGSWSSRWRRSMF